MTGINDLGLMRIVAGHDNFCDCIITKIATDADEGCARSVRGGAAFPHDMIYTARG